VVRNFTFDICLRLIFMKRFLQFFFFDSISCEDGWLVLLPGQWKSYGKNALVTGNSEMENLKSK